MLRARHYKMLKEVKVVAEDHELEMFIAILERELEKRSCKVIGGKKVGREACSVTC